jgi:hypothetical protein
MNHLEDQLCALYAKLDAVEQELRTLRGGTLVLNERYNTAVRALKKLTEETKVAALKAAGAAQNAKAAADRAVVAVRLAADISAIAASAAD